jgi:16S rRNA (uracil1498-N3)-methyltransferase
VKHRLYLPPPLAAGTERLLDTDQTHYVIRVLRLPRGAELLCFDGEGSAWRATLAAVSARSATVRLDALIEALPPPGTRLHLAQGLLKGAAMDQVVQKATELGATDIWLLAAARSNLALDAERLDRKRSHWQRVIESAATQCQQLHLPQLHGPMPLDECLAALHETRIMLLDPGAPPLPLEATLGSVTALIGPEGGWTDAERALALGHGAQPCGLGRLVLRAETAPLAVLAALRHSRRWDS